MSYAVDILVDRICNWKDDDKPLWAANDPKGHDWWLNELGSDPKKAIGLDVPDTNPTHPGGPCSTPLDRIVAESFLVSHSTGPAWRAIRDRLRKYIEFVYHHGYHDGFHAGVEWARAHGPNEPLPPHPSQTAITPLTVHDSY